jgi:hypothetical protein
MVSAAVSRLRAELAAAGGSALVADLRAHADAVETTQREINQRACDLFDFLTGNEQSDVLAGTLLLDVASGVQNALDSGARKVKMRGGVLVGSTITRPAGVQLQGETCSVSALVAAHNGPIISTVPGVLTQDIWDALTDLSIKNAPGFTSSIGVQMANLNQFGAARLRVEDGPLIGIQNSFVLNSTFERVSLVDCASIGLYCYSTILDNGNNRNTYRNFNIVDCGKGVRLDTSGTLQQVFEDIAFERCSVTPMEVLGCLKLVLNRYYLEQNAASFRFFGGTDIVLRDGVNVSAQQLIDTAGFGAEKVFVDGVYQLSGGGVLQHQNVICRDFGRVGFPSVAVASSDPNVLDDYRELNWVPGDVSGAGLVYVLGPCKATKVGREVTATFDITFPVTASGLDAVVGGLPYPSDGRHAVSVGFSDQSVVARGETVSGQSIFSLYTAAGVPVTCAQMSGKVVRGTVTYVA